MVTSRPKVFIDEAEILLTAIRGTVLVHLQDGLRPEHLKNALDPARALNTLASESGDEAMAVAAETLKTWLGMLAAESEPISDKRARSLLDQISELEVALIAYRGDADIEPIEVAEFVDESFRSFAPDADVITFVDPADESEMDSELLEVFRQEADSLLDTIQTNLQVLSRNGYDQAALWNIQKAAHTFKGAAGLVGLQKLSGLAHRIEDLLGFLSEHPAGSAEVFELLVDATDCLRSGSNGGRYGEPVSRIASLEQRFAESLKAVSAGSHTVTFAEIVPAARNTDSQTDHVSVAAPSTNGRKNPIVRVSLARLDDLVKIIRDLVSSRAAFEARIEELATQVQESSNNTLRLQTACGKIRRLEARRHTDISDHVRANLDQAGYELTETARDALVINSSLGEIKTRFEDVYVSQ
ncbi:MAG TPA: Hpt domain-containing protein, partial [Pyrinomonadaceae bacterium]